MRKGKGDPRFPNRTEDAERAGAWKAKVDPRSLHQPRRRAAGLRGQLQAIQEKFENLPLPFQILFTAALVTAVGGAAYYMLTSGSDSANSTPMPVGKAKKLSPGDLLAVPTPRAPARTNVRAKNLVDQIDARLTVSPAVMANVPSAKITQARNDFLNTIYDLIDRKTSAFACQLESIMERQPDPHLIYEGGPDRNFTVKMVMGNEVGSGGTVALFDRHTNQILFPVDTIHPPSFSSRIKIHEVHHAHINADNKRMGRKFYTADGKQLTSYSGPYNPDPSIRGRVEGSKIHFILHSGFEKTKNLLLILDKYFQNGYASLTLQEQELLTIYFRIRGLKSPMASITSYDSRAALVRSYAHEEISLVRNDEAIILQMTHGERVAKGSFIEVSPDNCLRVTIADILRYACRVRRLLDGSYILDLRSSLDTEQGLLRAPLADFIIRWTDYYKKQGIDPANQINEWDAIVQELFAPYPKLANFLFPEWAGYHRDRSSTRYQQCLIEEIV